MHRLHIFMILMDSRNLHYPTMTYSLHCQRCEDENYAGNSLISDISVPFITTLNCIFIGGSFAIHLFQSARFNDEMLLMAEAL